MVDDIIKKVAIVYPYVPHYRVPVFKSLLEYSGQYKFELFSGDNSIDPSIKVGEVERHFTPVKSFSVFTLQLGLFRHLITGKFSAVVFLANPYFLSTWFYAFVCRILGIKVLFWTHGWLDNDKGAKGVIRGSFYRLSNALLLYGERAKRIGLAKGWSENKLHVIYNSLDYNAQRLARERIKSLDLSYDGCYGQAYFCCVGRLTVSCRFDRAIRAIAVANGLLGRSISFVLIGSGEERDALEKLSRELNVRTIFLGELYEEYEIGRVLANSIALLSPGKVGLAAMHSLAYGVPVLTSGNFGKQMPEFEAIIPGVTGDFFNDDDIDSISLTLVKWISKSRGLIEENSAIRTIEDKYTPSKQVDFIVKALDSEFD